LTEKHSTPRVTDETKTLAAKKRARLAAELRANLARRKAQNRKRSDDGRSDDKPGGGGATA